MDAETTLHWLLASRLPGCTDGVLRQVIRQAREGESPLGMPARRWRAAGARDEFMQQLRAAERRPADPAWDRARRDLECLQALDCRLLMLGSPGYPGLLEETPDPPPLLYLRGNPECLVAPLLAVVGSRKASGSALRTAREFAMQLVRCGLGISSGLALGIDGAAHRAALDAGGVTVAVMGTGIDECYPRGHATLAAAICENGALVTEFPPGVPPRRGNFPSRNRVISGLSLGVLVVEAALRSGSLVTARMAAEQNREVFAVPHSIYDRGGQGCHRLLQQGAKLVANIEDILEELPLPAPGGGLSGAASACANPVPAHLESLLEAVGFAPASVDDLCLSAGLGAEALLAGLVELQLLDLVECRDGLYMRK